MNTTAVIQYSGLKRADDRYDAFFLAHLSRLPTLRKNDGLKTVDTVPFSFTTKSLSVNKTVFVSLAIVSALEVMWHTTFVKLPSLFQEF